MAFIQRFLQALLPRRWTEQMQAESQAWLVRCARGCERSVWDLGGIRWKAAGRSRRRVSVWELPAQL